MGSEKAQDQLTAQDTEKPADGMATEGKTEAEGDVDDDDEDKKKDVEEEEEEEPDPFEHGPEAYLQKMQEEAPDEDQEEYQVMRPRNIPRR